MPTACQNVIRLRPNTAGTVRVPDPAEHQDEDQEAHNGEGDADENGRPCDPWESLRAVWPCIIDAAGLARFRAA